MGNFLTTFVCRGCRRREDPFGKITLVSSLEQLFDDEEKPVDVIGLKFFNTVARILEWKLVRNVKIKYPNAKTKLIKKSILFVFNKCTNYQFYETSIVDIIISYMPPSRALFSAVMFESSHDKCRSGWQYLVPSCCNSQGCNCIFDYSNESEWLMKEANLYQGSIAFRFIIPFKYKSILIAKNILFYIILGYLLLFMFGLLSNNINTDDTNNLNDHDLSLLIVMIILFLIFIILYIYSQCIPITKKEKIFILDVEQNRMRIVTISKYNNCFNRIFNCCSFPIMTYTINSLINKCVNGNDNYCCNKRDKHMRMHSQHILQLKNSDDNYKEFDLRVCCHNCNFKQANDNDDKSRLIDELKLQDEDADEDEFDGDIIIGQSDVDFQHCIKDVLQNFLLDYQRSFCGNHSQLIMNNFLTQIQQFHQKIYIKVYQYCHHDNSLSMDCVSV